MMFMVFYGGDIWKNPMVYHGLRWSTMVFKYFLAKIALLGRALCTIFGQTQVGQTLSLSAATWSHLECS